MDLPTILSERLALRPFRESDAPEVCRMAGSRSIAEFIPNMPHPYAPDMAEEWIATHGEVWEKRTGVQFAICTRQAGQLIGAIGLIGIHATDRRAELGYWIGQEHWGQGFATEAARRVVRFGFEDLDLLRVHAAAFARNLASHKVLTNAGMQPEGTLRQHVSNFGVQDDFLLFGVLRTEYLDADAD